MKRWAVFMIVVAAAAALGVGLGLRYRQTVLQHHAETLATPATPDQPLVLSDVDLDSALQGLQELPRKPQTARPAAPEAVPQSSGPGVIIWRFVIDAPSPTSSTDPSRPSRLPRSIE
ncbi:MAG: hypothetical protein ACK4PI_08060 [Tepidisphaerales bacterium]